MDAVRPRIMTIQIDWSKNGVGLGEDPLSMSPNVQIEHKGKVGWCLRARADGHSYYTARIIG